VPAPAPAPTAAPAAAPAGWRGLHCEGAPLHTLFALLAWEVLFDGGGVADTFLTPYQDAPLDLDAAPRVFYARPARRACGAWRAAWRRRAGGVQV
jgi:hypothetical protein